MIGANTMAALTVEPGLSAEASAWLANRSMEEREGLLRRLLVEKLSTKPHPMAVQNDRHEVLGYVFAGNSSADWTGANDPELMAELDRRIANPGRKLTLEQLFEEVEADISRESERGG
jgi:hypothetical protein